VFGKMVAGEEALTKMEQVETRREGIFVMPKDRIEILSTYVYTVGGGDDAAAGDGEGSSRLKQLTASLAECHAQVQGLRLDLQSMRVAKLP
jgi:hypothetical protein